MSIEEWRKDEAGNIIVQPLVGYETMIAAKMAIGVRLDFLNHGDQFEKPSGNAQLVLTPIQAAQLGQALLSAAEMLANQNSEGPIS